jgi:excisionase family DNA binding protein
MPASSLSTELPVVALESERKALSGLEQTFQKSKSSRAQLVGPDGRTMILPQSLYGLLREVVRQLAAGNGVSLHPVKAELTTQQAADELRVSRPFLIKQLERGELPFHRTGTHRRIYLRDLLEYKTRRDAAAKKAVDDLARTAQELGIYDE